MRVLCVAAHPDDELIGVGGTLCKHVESGDTVDILLLSDGAMARYETETPAATERRTERRARAKEVGDRLGFGEVTVLEYWGNQLDDEALLDVVRDVEAKLNAFEPHVVYTHHYGDLNIDHQIVARAVRTAARPLAESTVDRLLAFESLSSTAWAMPTADTGFQPTVFVDIDPFLERKLEAIEIYKDELVEAPHPRNRDCIRANNQLWGQKAGLFAAEPFELVLERRR